MAKATSFLETIATDHRALGDDWSPARRGEAVRSSGPADPTGSAVADRRRQEVRARVVLVSRLLERALADIERADEAIGDALYAVDPGPPERLDDEWYPTTEPSAEVALALAYQAKRQAGGEL